MAQITGTFKVKKADVTLVWAPKAFSYGRILTEIDDLNAAASFKSSAVKGTFIYTNTVTNKLINVGDLLNAGSYSIRADFTPASKNFNTASIIATLVVNKNTIVMAFTSSEFTYGTALSSTHFNATAIDSYKNNVPGSFVYKNGDIVFNINDMLDAGSYDITVVFTPTIPENYTNSDQPLKNEKRN